MMTKAPTTTPATPDLGALTASVLEQRKHRDTLRAEVERLEYPTTDAGDRGAFYDAQAGLPMLKVDRYRAEAATAKAEAALAAARTATRVTVMAERGPQRRALMKALDDALRVAEHAAQAVTDHDHETASLADGITLTPLGFAAGLLGPDGALATWRRIMRTEGAL